MGELRSPFVLKSIVCPACHEESSHRFFRHRLFISAERESDQHVSAYKWLAPDVRRVHPPFYHIVLCPHCHFSDVADDFVDNKDTLYAPRTLRAIKKGLANRDLVELLAPPADDGDIDFAGALNLHLLTIHYYSLATEEQQDAYKLGSLYLRVAWLYREQGAGSSPEPGQAGAQAAAPAPREENCSPAILEALLSLEDTLGEARTRLEGVQEAIRQRAGEMVRGGKREGAGLYAASSAALRDVFEKQSEEVARLKEICQRDALPPEAAPQAAPVSAPASAPPPREGAASPDGAFMERLRGLWPEVPRDESEALKLAIRYLQRALAVDRRFDDFRNHSNVSKLVVDLMLRRGDANGAYQIVNGMYRDAAEARQKLQARLQSKDLSEDERRRIEGNVKRASVTVERAIERRTELLDTLLERQLPRIKQLVRDNASSVEDIERFLAANGVLPALLAHIRKSGKSLADLAASPD